MLRNGSEWRGLRFSVYGVAALAVFLMLNIDDWGRDFVGTRARIADDSTEALQPLVSPRSSDELEHAIWWAAKRIGSWEFVGTAGGENNRTLLFVRQSPLLRLRDDIVVRIEDRGNERVVTALSVARLKVGDLGRNPRNLRRLLTELRDVLDGAAPRPAPIEPALT
jgi:hypothetical protein